MSFLVSNEQKSDEIIIGIKKSSEFQQKLNIIFFLLQKKYFLISLN